MRKRKMVRQFMADIELQSEQEWQRQEAQLATEVTRVLRSGTPEENVYAEAFANLARPHAVALLKSAENTKHEANPLYGIMDEFTQAYLMVTDQRAIWSVSPKFETVLSFRYPEAVQVAGGTLVSEDPAEAMAGKGLTITYRPADFHPEMRRFNPTGELDATFLFLDTPESEVARMSILARTGHPGPHDDDDSHHAIERLRGLSTDVTSWELCPLCCHDLIQKTDSTVQCLSHRHLFSAPDVEPIIDGSEDHFGEIIDETGWMPILESEIDLVGVPLVWLVWRDRPFGPPMILDYETIRAVWSKQ